MTNLTLPKAISGFIHWDRLLRSRVKRGALRHRIAEAARGFVRCGLVLTPEAIRQDTARCTLAGIYPGLSGCPDAGVLVIWLERRLRRDPWPVDEHVDDALKDLAPHLYLMYGRVHERDPVPRHLLH
ncbi:MAG: hypothetical protein EOM91_20025 [Sphingobacteriia bacterium]|nr:hypothetical protein [Sphingobacteriia bacterium]